MPLTARTPYASAIFANGELDGPEIGTLVVVVDRGRNLPNRRTMGKQDPYFNARLGKEAKKTNPDRRGGQTPRWDQELRFKVHDSPDYYTLKVSVFDEGKRTELIGDAWIDLKNIVIPGGGEAEIWQDLKCKEKYAGEVRLEFTYYDSRPKVEKPTPKKQPSRVFDDGQSPSGSFNGRTPVKRRPLPTNPGSVEQQRSFASGPREIGTASHPKSAEVTPGARRRSIINNHMPQPVQQRRQSRPSQAQYHSHEEQDPYSQDAYDSQQSNYGHGGQNEVDINSEWHQHNTKQESAHYGTSQQPADYHDSSNFLPQLPPMNRAREAASSRSSGRSSRMQQEYEPSVRHASHEDTRSNSAQSVSDYHSDSQNGWSQSQAPSEVKCQQHGSDSWNQHYIDAPIRASSHSSYDYQPAANSEGPDDFQGGPHSHYAHPDQYEESADLPPPPPIHRALPSTEHAQQYESSPAQDFNEPNWSQVDDKRLNSYHDTRRDSQQRSRGHLTSRSEVSLARYAETFDDVADLHHPRSTNLSFEGHQNAMALQRHRGFSEEPVSTYRPYDLPSPQSPYFNSPQSSPTRKEVPHTPRSAGSFSQESYSHSPTHRRDSYQSASETHQRLVRHQPHHTQTYPPPGQHSPLASSPQYSLQHSRNGSITPNMSPTKPHPLSREHVMSSSPHEYPPDDRATYSNSYDPSMPLIRPLAISPRKSQPATPSSVDRQGRSDSRSTIPRKSVSPHPVSAEGRPHFSAYSPESFNVLNPVSPPAVQRDAPSGPIVDFHGNVIDPSDRLPEHSWAPEPTTTAKLRSDDHLPPSSWAPEPDNGRSHNYEPRIFTVRARASQGGSPSVAINVSCNARPPPEHRSSMFVSSPSPVESPSTASPTAPHVRNRLKKLNRPHSMASMSSSAPQSNVHDTWNPPIPPKIPMDEGRSVVPYGQPIDRLSYELQNIDIGNGSDPRRIGGRRLLGYNP